MPEVLYNFFAPRFLTPVFETIFTWDSGAHTDWGMLTVLANDSVAGLQIYHGGAWRDVPPRPGHFVVNVGGAYLMVFALSS